MNSNLLVSEKLKQGQRKRSWEERNRTDGDHSVFKRKLGRNRLDEPADRSNPLPSPIRGDASRSIKETMPSALGAENPRRVLIALQARLLGNVAQTADAAFSGCGIEATCASPDTADRASEVFEQDLAISLLGSANGTLEQIEAALQLIDDGSYGRCTECGGRIPTARLEAIPYATCCVQCAARQEQVA